MSLYLTSLWHQAQSFPSQHKDEIHLTQTVSLVPTWKRKKVVVITWKSHWPDYTYPGRFPSQKIQKNEILEGNIVITTWQSAKQSKSSMITLAVTAHSKIKLTYQGQWPLGSIMDNEINLVDLYPLYNSSLPTKCSSLWTSITEDFEI